MKVCRNCGVAPPKKGEPGSWCSACGAGVDYVDSETRKSMPRVFLFNTSIVTAYGSYRYEPLTLEDARDIALTNSAESAIGHQSTADILTELFRFPVEVRRTNNRQEPGDLAVVFKLRGRPEEGKILSREEVEAIGYDFGLLTRTA